MKRICRRGLCVLCMLALASGAFAQTQTDHPPVDLLEVDHKLYEYGYRDENCNGEMNDVVINALRNFQTINGLPVTGKADAETVDLLVYGTPISMQDYLGELVERYNEAPVLSEGSSGPEVLRLQNALKASGYFSDECSGEYGATTAAAVYRFQTANGLERTSVAAGSVFYRLYEGQPITWEEYVLASCASMGDSGANVRQIQLRLKSMGYFSGECTGRYGELTQQAVKDFQESNALGVNGDVGVETYELLFSNRAVSRIDASALRRGDSGTMAGMICTRLEELGYPANMEFDYRTELAVMIFQQNHGLNISGVADEETRSLLLSDETLPMESVRQVKDIEIFGAIYNQFYQLAAEMLGSRPYFESSFEFVQYVYLKGGVALLEESQFRLEALGKNENVKAGEVLVLRFGEDHICGIANGDDAIIYSREDGYIVPGYLDMLEADAVYRWNAGVFL